MDKQGNSEIVKGESSRKCRLGYCQTKNAGYQGGDASVINRLKSGVCPICGKPTEKKYFEGK